MQMASERRHKEAFVASLKGSQLLKSLLARNEQQEDLLRDCLESCFSPSDEGTKGDITAIWDQFTEEITLIGDEIYEIGLKELELREQEVKLFQESVKNAQKESQAKGIKVVIKIQQILKNLI